MESQTVHFTLGEDFGKLLMQIAQEHLIYNYDVQKALNALADFPPDVQKEILIGNYVVGIDTVEQCYVVGVREEGVDDEYPRINVIEWCINQSHLIEKNADDLTKAIDDKVWRIRNKGYYKTYSYELIFKFIAGNDKAILDDLREDEEIGELELLIKVVKDFTEKSLKILNVINWFEKTYPDKFNQESEMDVYEAGFNLTTLMQKFQSMLNCEWGNFTKDDSVENYVTAAVEIDKVLSVKIEPVDIMENWSAGWLSPEGLYYALNGEIANMLHNQIATALYEAGIIPVSDENIFNPDAWLEQHGWVKIHDNNINFAGCLNHCLLSKNLKDVNITQVQLDAIYRYICLCHNSIVRLGWRMEKISATRFRDFYETNPEMMNEKYFEF